MRNRPHASFGIFGCWVCAVLACCAAWLPAQQPPPYGYNPAVNNPNQVRPIDSPGFGSPPAGATATSPPMVPINPATQSGVFPSNSPGGGFDPYASSTTTAPIVGGPVSSLPPATVYGNPVNPSQPYGAPAIPPPSMTGPGYGYGNPYGAPPGGASPYGAPPSLPPSPYSGGGYGQPPGVYPNSNPNVLFPQASTAAADWYNNFNPQSLIYGAPPGSVPPTIRLNQGPRFRWSYIYGDDAPDALAIHDMDVALAIVYPSCCTGQPVFILPSFSLHLWSGPKNVPADLPASAYSAFVDTGWQTDPNSMLGAELGLRVGVFTDFNTLNSNSLRVMGRAIGRIGLTPRLVGKAGVIYLDRVSVKLLPAVGLLWQPNPNTRIDLFFPEPKLTSYLTTAGDKDMWWYVGGFYGGGSWSIERADTSPDQVDINDIRLVLGLEFGRNEMIRQGRRTAFFEVGYVFDRELKYKAGSADNMSLQDTIMFRAGIGY